MSMTINQQIVNRFKPFLLVAVSTHIDVKWLANVNDTPMSESEYDDLVDFGSNIDSDHIEVVIGSDNPIFSEQLIVNHIEKEGLENLFDDDKILDIVASYIHINQHHCYFVWQWIVNKFNRLI